MSPIKRILQKDDEQGTLQPVGVGICNAVHQQLEQILSNPLLAEMPERNALNLIFGRDRRDKTKLLGLVPVDAQGVPSTPVSQKELLARVASIDGFIDDLRTTIDTKTTTVFDQTVDRYAALVREGIKELTPEISGLIKDHDSLSTDRGCLANVKGMLRDLTKHVQECHPDVFKPTPVQIELL